MQIRYIFSSVSSSDFRIFFLDFSFAMDEFFVKLSPAFVNTQTIQTQSSNLDRNDPPSARIPALTIHTKAEILIVI